MKIRLGNGPFHLAELQGRTIEPLQRVYVIAYDDTLTGIVIEELANANGVPCQPMFDQAKALVLGAPELLAAAKQALAALNDTIANEAANVVLSPSRPAFKALAEAIRKTEGKL